jgi:glucokinase
MPEHVIGVDIGGSHITAALVDLEKSTVSKGSTKRQHVDSAASAEEIISAWSSCILQASENNQGLKIGIAMPGPFDYENGVSYIQGLGKYESLYGLNIKRMLSDVAGVPEQNIRMNNDAACFLLGEVYAGVARNFETAIAVTLGTGAGSAAYKNGISIDCNLGPSPFLDSIADEYLSTRWFVKRYEELAHKKIVNVKALADSYQLDPYARVIFSEFSINLALFLRDFLKRYDADAIVLGGNISLCSHLYLAEVVEMLKGFSINIPILNSTLGENAAMIGAACLFSSRKKTGNS